MPRAIFGVTGLNPYNILMLFFLTGWLSQKKKENLAWEVPTIINKLLFIYLLIFIIAVIRMWVDIDSLIRYILTQDTISSSTIIRDDLVNSLKFTIPGILFIYGINSRKRLRWAVWSISVLGILLATQIIMKVLPAAFGAEDIASRALRVLDRDIGYHRVDLAAMMGGFSWAIFSLISTSRSKLEKLFASSGFLLCTLAIPLTGGRAGMLAWLACGSFLALFKWKKLLFLGPLIIMLLVTFIPSLQERLFEGFTEDSHDEGMAKRNLNTVDEQGRDMYAVTSGRVIAWPMVIKHIEMKPIIGHGKKAMRRLNLPRQIAEYIGTDNLQFSHPHNAYLELLLDAGVLGAIPIVSLFVILVFMAIKKLKDREDIDSNLAAGFLIAFVVTQLIAGLGSQSFYPTNGTLPMWGAIGIFIASLRLSKANTEQNNKTTTSVVAARRHVKKVI